ncbi:sensor histidine kinase [Shewanella sp. 202IG2-18]|uniref:sensor histidine kinase n=1 Tax=Parashewanella hymeniacidonis TaxID=2807618 RepID=UPI0019618F04|nr:sensor histidine kinase [Parashewanella hymeniacidonis]MBM7072301.1 sensor histidine kinase [Parashewanella hymeniacidonis]
MKKSHSTFLPEDKFAWVYLVNLIFYFLPMFIAPMSKLDIVWSFVALALFLPLYFKLFSCKSSQAVIPLSLMFVLAVVITPINAGSLAFFSYVAFYAGFHFSLKRAAGIWGVQVLTIGLLNWYFFPNFFFIAWGSVLTLGIGVIGITNRHQQEKLKMKQQSNQEIKTLATIVERERIARDLHDVMGHCLSSITLKAELASKLIDNQHYDLAQKHLNELAEISRENLSQLRQTVSNYKHKGLETTVTELCQRLRDKDMQVKLDGELPTALSATQESHTCLILTELTNNMLKYSQATECQFQFEQNNDSSIVSINENQSLTSIKEGNGLKGIRERIEDIGGKFEYQLSPELSFTIQLPLKDKNND